LYGAVELVRNPFRLTRGVEDVLRGVLGEEVFESLERYARDRGLRVEDALKELVLKGVRYAELERMYGKDVADREVWDKRFYYLKIESAYIHCRLRVKELAEELRSFIMRYAGVVAALEICYERYAPKNERIAAELEELRKARKIADEYLDKYVLGKGVKDIALEGEAVSDEDVIKSIEEGLRKYREILKRRGGAQGSA